jgi:aminoglycoside/choline kinase family phosphotransferase
LAGHYGTSVAVRAAEKIWNRRHILRLRLADDRTVVLKRRPRRKQDSAGPALSFNAELTALEFLNPMDIAVAPRLLGADPTVGILIMEDLGPSRSLADSLLADDGARAAADLVSYAQGMGRMHAWSMGRSGQYAEIRERLAGPPDASFAPMWTDAIANRKEPFLAMAAGLGLPTAGVGEEIGSLGTLMDGAGYAGLVHSDLCPDNTHIADGVCRIIDFETSGWGPIALDAAYLLAPFPSCWCFARLPSEAADPALLAYRDQLAVEGVDLGPDWDAALTAALAGWVVARGAGIGRALDQDGNWGTTTVRPRLLTWLRSFTRSSARAGVLPRLGALAQAIQEQLQNRWPDAVVPEYPALAPPGAALARVPRHPDED